MPTAGLVVLPNTGHTVNLEEPDAFKRRRRFFAAVALAVHSTTGMT